MSCPEVAEVARDGRMLTIARTMLGGEAVPFRATLFSKTEQANWLIAWHQDTALPIEERSDVAGWGPWSVKQRVTYAHSPAWALERVVALRLHLDPSIGENGPLRVIPGSHNAGVLTDAEVLARVQSGVQVECLSPVGGVVAMRPLLIHASSKSTSGKPRRVLHIEYAVSLDMGPGVRLRMA